MPHDDFDYANSAIINREARKQEKLKNQAQRDKKETEKYLTEVLKEYRNSLKAEIMRATDNNDTSEVRRRQAMTQGSNQGSDPSITGLEKRIWERD